MGKRKVSGAYYYKKTITELEEDLELADNDLDASWQALFEARELLEATQGNLSTANLLVSVYANLIEGLLGQSFGLPR